MWNVIEVLNNGASAEFGPFPSYTEAVKFLLDTEMADTERNLRSATIKKEKTDET